MRFFEQTLAAILLVVVTRIFRSAAMAIFYSSRPGRTPDRHTQSVALISAKAKPLT